MDLSGTQWKSMELKTATKAKNRHTFTEMTKEQWSLSIDLVFLVSVTY